MGLTKFRPITPSGRYKQVADFAELTVSKPHWPLTLSKSSSGGRNNHGHITKRGRGGGHKRRIRIVDFRRERFGVPATILTVEYDPNRSSRISLVQYEDGEKRYIICPDGIKVGEKIVSGPDAEVKLGNHLPLSRIPEGSPIHNIELLAGRGGKMVRAAGGMAQILAKEGAHAHVKMPSGEVRLVPVNAYATIGQCSNLDHEKLVYGKAGKTRWMGRRPITRAIVRNPVDHPMGGGEAKSKSNEHPKSPWGQKSKGLKTRKKSKITNKFIVKDRRK